MSNKSNTRMNNAVMKDTALFNEGNSCLQVLSHSKVQHDAGQPPPAGVTQVIGSTENILMTYDHSKTSVGGLTCRMKKL